MPTTPLLGITQLSPTQTGKETTINNAILALEAAENATLAVAMGAGDVTLSVAQFTGYALFNLSGQVATRILNIPAQVNGVNSSRVFVVRNSGPYSVTVQVTGGAGTALVVNPNETRLLDVDGAGNVRAAAQPPSAFAIFTDTTTARVVSAGDISALVRMNNASANTYTLAPNSSVSVPVGSRIYIEQAGSGRTTIVAGAGVTLLQPSTQAQLYLRAQYSQVWAIKVGTDTWVLGGDFGGLLNYNVGTSVPSNILSNEVLIDHCVVQNFTFPANFSGSQASAGTNPSASYVLTISKTTGGVTTTVGTITIATNGFVSYATTGGVAINFVAGDLLTVTAPSTVDGAIARLRFTLKGNN